MDSPYRPIDCGFHDTLLALATLRRAVTLRLADGQELRGTIIDVFTRDAAEWLRLDAGAAVRLDHILTVRDEQGDQTLQPPAVPPL